MSTSCKKLFTTLLFLYIFLDLPIKSKESSDNLRKNSNFLRQLEEEKGNPDTLTFFSLSLIVINETITCDDNTIILPLFNPNSELNFSEINISLTVDGELKSLKPISCNPKNGAKNVLGLNITEYKSSVSKNTSVTINFEQNTSDFSSLFENTNIVKEVKFENISTSFTIKSLNSMFANCSNLEAVDFGNYTFKGISNFSYLFDGCKNLANVKFNSEENITDVESLDGMFNGCEKLLQVNLTHFTFENVKTMSNLFNGCKHLTDVTFSETINSTNLIDIDGMFEGCESIEYPKIQYFDFSKVKKMKRLFKGCKVLKQVEFKIDVQIQYVEDLSFVFEGCENLTSVNLSSFTFENVKNMSNLFNGCKDLKSVNFSETINSTNLIDIDGMFEGCESIEKPEIQHFDFSKVTKMNRLFKGCKKLDHVEFNPDIKIQNVEDLSFVFDGCVNLIEVNLTQFQFEKVGNMSNLFNNCSKLEKPHFPKEVKAPLVKSIDYMFGSCEKLTSFNLSIFTFEKLESASYVFQGAKNLNNVTVGNFNCTNCKTIAGLFDGCTSLKEVDLSGLIITEKLVNFSSAFNGCTSLKSVNLSGLSFPSNCSMDGMFSGCGSLTYLDLSNCIINGTINFTEMFAGVNLTSLNVNIEGVIISEGLLNFFKANNVNIKGNPKKVTKDPNDNSETSSNCSNGNCTSPNGTSSSETSSNGTSSSGTTSNETSPNGTTPSSSSSNETTEKNATIIQRQPGNGLGGKTAGIVIATVAVVVVVVIAVVISITISTTVATTGGAAVAAGAGAAAAGGASMTVGAGAAATSQTGFVAGASAATATAI